MLEKWQCHECEKGFLLLAEETKDTKIHCPFCGNTEHVEAVTRQSPEEDFEKEFGCLWPGYNQFDKLGYQMSLGLLSPTKAAEYANALLCGEKVDLPKIGERRDNTGNCEGCVYLARDQNGYHCRLHQKWSSMELRQCGSYVHDLVLRTSEP